ncbi:hypothetical protein Nepgr_015782 [Nepenthes gracilis]|uniref:Uncharacterized protein n=1 Tax=Nepenthes gracilis TaxID=150966 RepID=A0AAD3SP48_NEPGR|nr:hypothetical protein Nepgr_015782 [Nepenthes gracilis]
MELYGVFGSLRLKGASCDVTRATPGSSLAVQPDPATAPRWHSKISKLPMQQKQQGNSSHVDHQGSRIHKKDPHHKQHAPLQRQESIAEPHLPEYPPDQQDQ